jgi:hypothetical protein
MKGPGAHLHIVWLSDQATALCPELLQRENQLLKGLHGERVFLVDQ